MRVLMIANYFMPYGFIGGAEVATYHTCQGLLQRGVDCRFLALNHRLPEAFDREYALDGISVHWVSLPRPRRSVATDIYDPRLFRAVRRELERVRPDVVHIHNVSGASLAPHLACRVAGVPVVNTLHDLWLLCPNNMLYRADGSCCDPAGRAPTCRECFRCYDFWGAVPGRRALFAALVASVTVFISPSQAYISQHVRAGYAASRFRLVRYGLMSGEVLQPRSPGVRAIVETAYEHRTVVFAAGGWEHKGAAVLLQAVPILLRHIGQLRIVVAGGGASWLLNAFRQYEPRVRVLGYVPFADMRPLFASADLTVVPSVWFDNSPVVIYESLQMGTPVVGSAFGGIPELIHEGETGYTVAAGDPVALAEKVVLHFARPAYERRQMRLRCVEEARTRLSLQRHTDAILATYREVLEG
jgi:glycosyltransferase involved in cell wall biosynthesis